MKVIVPILALLLSVSFVAHAGQFGLFSYKVSNGEVTITDYSEDAVRHVEIPAVIEEHIVACIRWQALSDCTRITSVSFPDSVSAIDTVTFSPRPSPGSAP